MNGNFRSGLYWDGSKVVWYQRHPDIQAVAHAAAFAQQSFAWGDPGTEAGHTIDANDTDLTVTQDGSGNLDKFLRIELEQTVPNADANLTQTFRLQRQLNTDGWGTCPTSGAAEPVILVDHGSITQGGDTTDRMGTSTEAFLTNNNGIIDTSADTSSITFTASQREQMEILASLRFQDANLSDGDQVHFRIVFNDDTVLEAYTVADATLNWNAPAGDDDLIAAATHVPPNTLLRM